MRVRGPTSTSNASIETTRMESFATIVPCTSMGPSSVSTRIAISDT